MIRDRMKFKMATDVVNLTGTEICMYDDVTGRIERFDPVQLAGVRGDMDSPNLYFAVNDFGEACELCRFGKELDNVAIVSHKRCGRGGCIVSYLVWAKNPRVGVLLRR